MMLPDYWLTRPSVKFDEKIRIAFDELLESTLNISGCPNIQFALPWPKWQFLCHVADHHDIALHGSGDPYADMRIDDSKNTPQHSKPVRRGPKTQNSLQSPPNRASSGRLRSAATDTPR